MKSFIKVSLIAIYYQQWELRHSWALGWVNDGTRCICISGRFQNPIDTFWASLGNCESQSLVNYIVKCRQSILVGLNHSCPKRKRAQVCSSHKVQMQGGQFAQTFLACLWFRMACATHPWYVSHFFPQNSFIGTTFGHQRRPADSAFQVGKHAATVGKHAATVFATDHPVGA